MGRQTLASTRMIELSPPDELDGISLARAIRERRSVRDFRERTLTWSDIGQLVWAAQGVTDDATGLRTARKYGARAERYVQLEAGHVAQNVLLMAAGLGLGGTPVGAFNDDAVARTLGLDQGETPLYLVPIGLPAARST